MDNEQPAVVCGHLPFLGVLGPELTETERWELVEFLKTL